MQRFYSQIPKRSRIIYSINQDGGFTDLTLANTITANPKLIIKNNGTILNTTNATTFLTATGNARTFTANTIFKDLGKQLHVQTNGRTDYIFTYVLELIGSKTEGVPDNYNIKSTTLGNFWLCTWAADDTIGPFGVYAVRAG